MKKSFYDPLERKEICVLIISTCYKTENCAPYQCDKKITVICVMVRFLFRSPFPFNKLQKVRERK